MSRVLICCLAGLCGPAFAYDYGRWMAPDVDIPALGNTSPAMQDIGSPLFWIKAMNTQIMATNPANATQVDRWIPNDTITICNGTLCETWVYLANGNFARISLPIKDDGRGYKNTSVTRVSGGQGDWNAYYRISFPIVYFMPQTLPKTATVTVRPAEASVYGYGAALSMEFDWGTNMSSDVFYGGGGGNGGSGPNKPPPTALE